LNFLPQHKYGVPDEDDPTNSKLVYGLEELFNKYHVDLVITGHEHTYEMFPPIQLHEKMNRVVPHKYWWRASATSPTAKDHELETGLTATAAAEEPVGSSNAHAKDDKKHQLKHQFMAFTVCVVCVCVHNFTYRLISYIIRTRHKSVNACS
jgi:hypothetical protein